MFTYNFTKQASSYHLVFTSFLVCGQMASCAMWVATRLSCAMWVGTIEGAAFFACACQQVDYYSYSLNGNGN